MEKILQLVETQFDQINNLIIDSLRSRIERVEDVSQYLVNNGGKRIRPLITTLVACALGKTDDQNIIKLAAAIEFLHTATLLHDDVVDMSDLRRGQPTANANWGNASSVLVGDFVYSKAFQLLVRTNDLVVMRILSDTTAAIAEGEVQQLMEIGNTSLSQKTYYEVIDKKTAELFAGACESAAVLAGGTAEQQQAMAGFGRQLGVAFQLIDDYLDYAGSTESLGKNVGDDLAEGKMTLPTILTMEKAFESNQADAIALKDIIDNKDSSKFSDVVDLVRKYDALSDTLSHARAATDKCEQYLSRLEDSHYKNGLAELLQFQIERTQ